MNTPSYSVLVLLYKGVNTLDVNGPLDILCNAALRNNNALPFHITTTAKTYSADAYEFITLQADLTFQEALDRIEDYDILLIPGAASAPYEDEEIKYFIRGFMSKDNSSSNQKWLVSICTGSLLAGAAGAFNGLDATSHFLALDTLEQVCNNANAPMKNPPERMRWVDGGLTTYQGCTKTTRVLSSGGISCGLDATLFLVYQCLNKQAALDVTTMMDYNWNVLPADGIVTTPNMLMS